MLISPIFVSPCLSVFFVSFKYSFLSALCPVCPMEEGGAWAPQTDLSPCVEGTSGCHHPSLLFIYRPGLLSDLPAYRHHPVAVFQQAPLARHLYSLHRRVFLLACPGTRYNYVISPFHAAPQNKNRRSFEQCFRSFCSIQLNHIDFNCLDKKGVGCCHSAKISDSSMFKIFAPSGHILNFYWSQAFMWCEFAV